MTDPLTGALEDATAQVAAVADPVERFRAARERRAAITQADRELTEIEKAVVWELYEGRTWAEVGKILGFSGSRAEAIARGR
ncbi:hypothetical protein ACH492_22255 [Streptomyces sp. NPDC019443]|uniref:hypothetical protein n=1 Tax=Streptomyces sp. NPDC019443 TaxID=3365061 RepID=UPI0037982695